MNQKDKKCSKSFHNACIAESPSHRGIDMNKIPMSMCCPRHEMCKDDIDFPRLHDCFRGTGICWKSLADTKEEENTVHEQDHEQTNSDHDYKLFYL